MAFQIIAAMTDTAILGRRAGKDAKADKTTFVKLHGLEKSRSVAALRELPGDSAFLTALVESMAQRVS